MSNETIVLYHGGCRDGFCAAWVVNKYLHEKLGADPSNTEFIPAYYGQQPPDVKDKDVIIVDFCYPLEIMLDIIKDCKSLIWLDHHKTAEPFARQLEQFNSSARHVKFVFDNTRSGAGLAWDYFFDDEPRPWLVDYVEDRDLWAKKLNNTDVVNAYIACLEFDFNIWNDTNDLYVEDVAEYGQVAEMKTEQYVREVCKNAYFTTISADSYEDRWFRNIPTVNICQVDCTEVLHELCKLYPEAPFTLYWFKRQDGLYQYGLRSIGDFDCSQVAKLFDGEGHKNAAGFQLPYLLEELK